MNSMKSDTRLLLTTTLTRKLGQPNFCYTHQQSQKRCSTPPAHRKGIWWPAPLHAAQKDTPFSFCCCFSNRVLLGSSGQSLILYVAHLGLKLAVIFLPQPLEHLDDRGAPPHSAVFVVSFCCHHSMTTINK